jgi:hypothetical protein
VFYSKQDVSTFSFLARQNNAKKEQSKALERALDSLQEMSNYCIVPGCRRKFVLTHFGDKNPVDCSGCDYCTNPIKTKKAIEVACAASDFNRTILKKEAVWDGQWQKPCGDDDDDVYPDNDLTEGDLRITKADADVSFESATSFQKRNASATLAKFEVRLLSFLYFCTTNCSSRCNFLPL